MPRDTIILPSLVIHEVAPEECIVIYRTVRVADPDDPDLPLSLRSHREEGLAPRYREMQHAVLSTAISTWRALETANYFANRYRDKRGNRKHGDFLAQLVLTYGRGFDYLDRAIEPHPEHMAVWGDPAALARAVVDIVPVR